MQRLDANPVAGDEQLLGARVPDRERKHPAQFVHAHLAEVFVQVNDGLRVAVCAELVAFGFEPVAQLGKVVDLTIEHDPHRAVLVAHRLMAAADIDDAEPCVR